MKFYYVSVQIKGFDPSKVLMIKQAVSQVCPFNNWYVPSATKDGLVLEASCDTIVNAPNEKSSKEAAHELAREMALKAWEANGGYCGVHVGATCLSDSPDFEFDITKQ